jgi:DNA-binding NarL/FixJ family response regulator
VCLRQSTEEFVEAIRRVQAGRIYLSEELSQALLQTLCSDDAKLEDLPFRLLSDREFAIFEMYGHGLMTAQIAERLCLSSRTIDTYRHRIKEKLRLESINELVCQASQWVAQTTPHPDSHKQRETV